jgi:hypothetical protein
MLSFNDIIQPPTLTFFISKIPEPGTTISGFADNKKNLLIQTDRP